MYTPPSGNNNTLYQQYVAYSKGRIKEISKGFKLEDLNKFLLKAWATVPISGNEILDLSVYILRDRKIEDFTVNYRTILDSALLRNYKIKIC